MLDTPVQIRKTTLETTSISKLYKGRKVLDDVTISLQKGEIVGLLGRTAPINRVLIQPNKYVANDTAEDSA